MLETDYPYTSGATGDDSTDCQYDRKKATDVTVIDWKFVGFGATMWVSSEMKAALAKQPIAVAITANNKYIHSYASGIIHADGCLESVKDEEGKELNPMNHAVLVVGYGTDETTGLDYWLVKNSWNTTWGDSGYFNIKIFDGMDCGTCGVT